MALNRFNCVMSQLVYHGDEERKTQPAFQVSYWALQSEEFSFKVMATTKLKSP